MVDYHVIDINAALFVTREGNSFRVHHLGTGKVVILPSSKFRGLTFKYLNEFVNAFRKGFTDDESRYVYLSTEADNYLTQIMHFNRIEF